MDLHFLPDLRPLVMQVLQRVQEECAASALPLKVELDQPKTGVVVYWEDGPSLAALRPRLEALGTATTTVTVADLDPVVETTCLVRVGRSYSHRAIALGAVLLAQEGLPPAPSIARPDRFSRPWTPEVVGKIEDVDEYVFDTLYNFTTPLVDRMDVLLEGLDLSDLPSLPAPVDPRLTGAVDLVDRLTADVGTEDFSDVVLWMVSGGYDLVLSLLPPLVEAASPAGS